MIAFGRESEDVLDRAITNSRVGVLGGIGPESTGEFYNKLISELQNRGLIKSNRDYPQIIVNSIPAPELIHETVSDEDLRAYRQGIEELDAQGVDFIVMVCNTIHFFYERLQKGIKTPILDLREEVRDALLEEGIKSITVIGTPTTIKKGLYRFEGIRSLDPSDEEIDCLSNAIFNFNKGIEREQQVQVSREICDKYLALGSERIVLGCTEFAVMLGAEDMPTLNTIVVLVDATIRRVQGLHR